MPNKRDPNQAVTSFAAPRTLLDAARRKAADEGRKLSDVIREALEHYVRSKR